jgi:hypothetical protein
LHLVKIVFVAAAAVTLAACQSSSLQLTKELKRNAGEASVVIMPSDVQLFELSAGGSLEPRGDWTQSATSYLTSALHTEGETRRIHLVAYDDSNVSADQSDQIRQVSKLFGVIGDEIVIHQYSGPMQLPTKDGSFNWSIGPAVQALRNRSGADYALLTYLRDSYADAGRIALIAIAAIAGVGVQGGVQTGYAALVDLNTGDIVWFNRLIRGTGDARDLGGARGTARALLEGFPQ